MIKTGGALRTMLDKPNNEDCAYEVTVEKQFFFNVFIIFLINLLYRILRVDPAGMNS